MRPIGIFATGRAVGSPNPYDSTYDDSEINYEFRTLLFRRIGSDANRDGHFDNSLRDRRLRR